MADGSLGVRPRISNRFGSDRGSSSSVDASFLQSEPGLANSSDAPLLGDGNEYNILLGKRSSSPPQIFGDRRGSPQRKPRFFFAHCGWLMMKRHPENIRQARKIDMTDILADRVAMFQKKYATLLQLLFCFAIPTAIPVIFWEEKLLHAVMTECIIRYVTILHVTWSVNSVAHLLGHRPYNRFINPAENIFVSFCALGEGSHNYHHTFPWDYKTSEFSRFTFNFTRLFIDSMARLGWAYDLRQPSPEFIEEVTQRLGQSSG